MKCKRIPLEVEVIKYSLGQDLEDGFELLSDVVTKSWVHADNLIQINRDGDILTPYIFTRRGRTFLQEGDYVIIEPDGSKQLCGEDKLFDRYEEIK